MFTGIIKAKGIITALDWIGGDLRLSVKSDGLPWKNYAIGESIAINGVCLTAVSINNEGFNTDISTETLDVTALGKLEIGSIVNLEPSLSLGDRLGGHLVSGHVDCIGRVKSKSTDARSIKLSIEIPIDYAHYIAKKGSVCIDGVSLTINNVNGNELDLNIIPHTANETIISDYYEGTIVNVEFDLLVRYLERLITKEEGVTK
jgi:riboflavin synthase